jgi:iron complex transport system ATP-binding protein
MLGASELVYRVGRRTILDGVSATFEPGRLHLIIGPNGSGKSTLLRALLGVVPLTGGSATLDGRAAGAWGRRELARQIGVVTALLGAPFFLFLLLKTRWQNGAM